MSNKTAFDRPLVLIVDDQPKNLQLAAAVLNEHYRLVLANNGEKGIESAKEKHPDLILLDIMMPEMSGFDVCQVLKATPETKEIPVIFLTAKTEEEDIVNAYSAGGVDYITKPFRAKELLARISAHVELKRRQDEIKLLNEELKAINLQKDKLFSVIAHDLRGPSKAIIAALDLMMQRNNMPEKDLGKFLSLIKSNTVNLYELLEDLLLWSSNQLDRVNFEPDIWNVKEIVEVVFGQLKSQADAKGVSLIYEGEDDASVKADQNMLKAVLRNLVSNAIKFSESGKSITISNTAAGAEIEISVKDEGTGIKEEDLQKLFDKTTYFTTYGTNGEKGSGIGLDMCREFVERHGGKIWVESKYGEGSTFKFTLPG